MNKEARREVREILKKENQNFIVENAQSIYELIESTEKLIKSESQNIVQNKLPKYVLNRIENDVNIIEIFEKMLPAIKKLFLYDGKYNNGFAEKSVVSALKMYKFKEKLNAFNNEVEENKGKGIDGTNNYVIFHDLSANKTEVKMTFDILVKALPVIIANLRANNVTERTDYLINNVTIFERRLCQLYCLYEDYMKDNGDLEVYYLLSKVFKRFDKSFENLIGVYKFR